MPDQLLPRKIGEDCLADRLDRLGILDQREFLLSRIAAASVAVAHVLETGSEIKRPSRFFLLATC
jgi:hypothetical protein